MPQPVTAALTSTPNPTATPKGMSGSGRSQNVSGTTAIEAPPIQPTYRNGRCTARVKSATADAPPAVSETIADRHHGDGEPDRPPPAQPDGGAGERADDLVDLGVARGDMRVGADGVGADHADERRRRRSRLKSTSQSRTVRRGLRPARPGSNSRAMAEGSAQGRLPGKGRLPGRGAAVGGSGRRVGSLPLMVDKSTHPWRPRPRPGHDRLPKSRGSPTFGGPAGRILAPRPMPVAEVHGARISGMKQLLEFLGVILLVQGVIALVHEFSGELRGWGLVQRLDFLDGHEIYASVALIVLALALFAAVRSEGTD